MPCSGHLSRLSLGSLARTRLGTKAALGNSEATPWSAFPGRWARELGQCLVEAPPVPPVEREAQGLRNHGAQVTDSRCLPVVLQGLAQLILNTLQSMFALYDLAYRARFLDQPLNNFR